LAVRQLAGQLRKKLQLGRPCLRRTQGGWMKGRLSLHNSEVPVLDTEPNCMTVLHQKLVPKRPERNLIKAPRACKIRYRKVDVIHNAHFKTPNSYSTDPPLRSIASSDLTCGIRARKKPATAMSLGRPQEQRGDVSCGVSETARSLYAKSWRVKVVGLLHIHPQRFASCRSCPVDWRGPLGGGHIWRFTSSRQCSSMRLVRSSMSVGEETTRMA